MSTDLVKPDPNVSLEEFDYGDDAGKGFENQTRADVTIPWMKLAQAMTPEITKELIPDLKPGMWFNSVTQQVYPRDKGFLFVPALTKSVFAKWTPRKGEGSDGKSKFYGLLEPDDEVVMNAIKNGTFGNYRTTIVQRDPETERDEEVVVALVDTRYVYGVVCSEDGLAEGMAAISFTRTKIRPFKAWNSRMSNFRLRTPRGMTQVPMFSHLTRISADKDFNEKKQEYWVPKFSSFDPRGLKESLLKLNDERYLLGRQCYEQMNAGAIKVNYENAEGEVETDGEEDSGGKKSSGAFM